MTTPRPSTPIAEQAAPTIVLLGQPCGNTSLTAAILHDASVELAATILADSTATPAGQQLEPGRYSIYRAATPRATRRFLEHIRPDLVIAACYPWRLSRRSRAASRCGIMNIHPSPLPHGRGPDPVFWVYRNGERETGVTIPLMDDGLDTGPILAQQRWAVPDTMDAVSLERHLFEVGAEMTAHLVAGVITGAAHVLPQPDLAVTYQPAPTAHDWIISPLLPAAWAWRFAKGVEPLQGPLTVQTRGQLVPVRRAIAWDACGIPPDGRPAGTITVQFQSGWVAFER